MDAWTDLPCLWAQTVLSGSPVAGPPAAPDTSLMIAILALRRWCGSLTLSPPVPAPGLFSPGLLAWLAGLAALLSLVSAIQGPGRAVSQIFDLRGLLRLFSESLDRLRKSGRLVAVVIGTTIVTWTIGQATTYGKPQGRDEFLLLTRGHSLADVALGQGVMAALTPLRDLAALGMMIPLLAIASVLLFRFANDRWGTGSRPPREIRTRASGWATVGWIGTAIYLVYYRFVATLAGQNGLPTGSCLIFEVILVPALMALVMGLMMAWTLTELRGVPVDGSEAETVDVLGSVLLIPAATLTVVLAFPGAFVAVGTLLISSYATPGTVMGTVLAPYLRWILGWGLAEIQALGLISVGMLGAVAWSRGTVLDALQGYGRLLRAEGGRVLAVVAMAGLAAGLGSTLAYFLVLALPASSWVLAAADSYAHYASLPVGLLLLAALVELGERSLPEADRVGSQAGSLDTSWGAGV